MGVEREVITEGDGATSPSSGDMLTMHYVGTLVEGGSEFDSSYRRNKPFQFVIGIGQVIRGWDEGIIDMTLGEKAVLTMTSDYGYGENGAPPAIPPNAALKFEVTLLAIGDKKCADYDSLVGSGGWSSYCQIL